MNRSNKGKFITFEGGEGTGKSTQTHKLRERLEKAGHNVVETREPGGTPGAEIVRHLLKTGAVEPLGAFAEAVMIAAARDDHVTLLIRPALDKGSWVVCDRFCDSTKAYQGAGGGVDDKLLDALERLTVGETLPDLTVVLDAPAEIALARARERGEGDGERQEEAEANGADRFEKESLAFHDKLRRAFLKIAEDNPERCVVIDATADKEAVAEKVWDSVSQRLKP
jgi:dTMP kinase